MSAKERLKKVFIEALELPAELEVDTLEYRKCAQWDSVGHMRMVAALETEFDVMLETDQILDLSSFTKGLEILQAHGVVD